MSDAIVDVQHVTRRFRDKTALNDVSLSIPKGIVFGLVGENGAGKTTLLKHLLGLLQPDEGSVQVFGIDPAKQPELVLARLGYLSEDRDMPDWMRVDQVIAYRSAFYPNWDQAYAADLIKTFDLPVDQRVKTLSRGQLARLGLLLAIAYRPELLILDEPSSGLDPVVRRDILGAIIRAVADDGRTVLFSSHLLDEVQRVSDRVAMLHGGQIVLCDDVDQLVEQHARFVVRLPQDLTGSPVIPGAIHCDGSGREWSVLCNGQQDQFRDWLGSKGGEVIEQSAPSLEEIFVARCSAVQQERR